MKKALASALMMGALAFALAACGGGSNDNNSSPEPSVSAPADGGSASTSQEVVIKATSWEFDKKQYEVPANTPVKITLQNDEGAHGVKADGTDLDLGPGKESQVVTLEPGTYEIRCSIMCGQGHSRMKAELVVK